MLKVQQKIAGCCRSAVGATALCHLRSAISCLKKQRRDVLADYWSVRDIQPKSNLPGALPEQENEYDT